MDNQRPGLEVAAGQVLCRAVQLDQERRFTEALACYREGIGLLLEVIKTESNDEKKQKLRLRVENYMDRAEKLKIVIGREKDAGSFQEQIQIKAGSVGHSYESVFRGLVDDELTIVEVEDPYIRMGHQFGNFVRFCEMLLKRAQKLKSIVLTTGPEQSHDSKKKQESVFQTLRTSLAVHGVDLKVNYSMTLHDRFVRFNNGWIVQMGRGLDYFKPVPKDTIGYFDMDLRPCHETTIIISHQKNIKFS